MTMSIHKRVENGVALLDSVYPNWDERIDLMKLNMIDCKLCVCGQLFGSFMSAIKVLDIDTDTEHFDFVGAEYGFNVEGVRNEGEQYEMLREEWTDVIKDRRG